MTSLGNIMPRDGGGFAPVPSGKYKCEIVDHTEPTKSKGGLGYWVKATWKVIEGEHAGRLIFQTINFKHTNPVAEEIGIKELEQIAFACNHSGNDFDLGDCHNIPCQVSVGIQEATDKYEAQNFVRRVQKLPKSTDNAEAGVQGPKSSGPAGGGSAPWRQ